MLENLGYNVEKILFYRPFFLEASELETYRKNLVT